MTQQIKFNYYYPYELNEALNSQFSNHEQVSNYTSLLTDRERFENLLNKVSTQKQFLDSLIGLELQREQDVYVIRAELFQCCPTPLIIEYDIHPEVMVLYVIKEMIKNTLAVYSIRCIDEVQQEELLNATLLRFFEIVDNNLNTSISKYLLLVHNHSAKQLEKKGFEYNQQRTEENNIDENNTLLQIIEQSYEGLY
ncbi:MAG: hypothetical protein ACLFPL_01595 [Candidatus Nanoarchaeia archaeon]